MVPHDDGHENALLAAWRQMRPFRRLINGLRKGEGRQQVHGLTRAAASFFCGAVALAMDRPVLVVTPTEDDAQRLVAAARSWFDSLQLAHFPALETLPFEAIPSDPRRTARRQAARALLSQASAGGHSSACLVVASARAAARRLAPPQVVETAFLTLESGSQLPPERVERALVQGGYTRVERVDAPGEFARRGGIMDIYPVSVDRTAVEPHGAAAGPKPLRLDFYGDVLESIRLFAPAEQRSLRSVERVRIAPVTETPMTAAHCREAAARLGQALASFTERAAANDERRAAVRLQNRLGPLLERLEQGDGSGVQQHLPFLYPELTHLFKVLPEQGLAVLWRPGRVRQAWQDLSERAATRLADAVLEGRLLPGHEASYMDAAQLQAAVQGCLTLEASLLPQGAGGTSTPVEIRSRPAPVFGGNWSRFAERYRDWRGQGYRIFISASGSRAADQLAAHLQRLELPARCDSSFWRHGGVQALGPGSLVVAPGELGEGFVLPGAGVIALPAEALTGRRRPRRAPALYAGEGDRVHHHGDLELGDYVVHIHHGIGRYRGMRTLEVQGTRRDYLFLEYAGEDRLYVPVDQLELVQKYRGADGSRPKIYSLGTKEWERVKKRVRESVRELAGDLLELYAAREALQGYSFSPDTEWQREFEAAFPYDETAGQRRAIQETKEDMESPQPMDRLLCGDVGYGKTEVAMRAAFKAVMDGKQVAVLVPTTVLAQQHYLTFSDRFQDFPVDVDVLSRFQTRSEQASTLDGVRQGRVDILIGTHRLLQEDVAFSDLGLLVVDEEHRFGVAHKERLKQLRQNVDVLTLTATPIPRTLHMALVSLRDMSTIETPPPGRYPIETQVAEYEDELIRDAIRRELERGGQVFYVHNRVRSIDFVQRRLERLVPEASVAVGHGQLDEEVLETVMLDFVAGEADVLLCTTIIESGLDIANANTLIVEDADRLGLAQLYQLRGRVGRSTRVAYAYFTFRHRKALSQDAEQRLAAIREFSELGSGYQIAMRDLEIRGAGNLLGSEQHGFIASVGFELYCQLLASAVRELKGDTRRPVAKPVLELRVDAFIPDDYIASPAQKIECYKRINTIDSVEAAADVLELLRDRFGQPPPPVLQLVELERTRVLAGRAGILSITPRGQQQLVLTFAGMEDDLFQEAVRLVQDADDLRFEPADTPVMVLDVGGRAPSQRLARLASVAAALLLDADAAAPAPHTSLRIN